jgi:outer membrane protein
MTGRFLLAWTLLASPQLALAQNGSDAVAIELPEAGVIGATPSNWRLGAALGYGIRTNPLIQSEDIPVIVDLDIAWFGERFFFDNGDLGLTLADNEQLTFNVIARVNSDRVFFGKTDTRFVRLNLGSTSEIEVEVTVPDRDYAIELGAELLTDGDWGRLQVSAFRDASSTHHGYELAANYSYGIRSQRWYLQPSLGISFKSEALNAYYWGVRPEESNEALPAYAPVSGTNVALRLLGSYQLTPVWTLNVAAEYERLNDQAAASPIVRDRRVVGFFAGFGYRF